MKDEVFFTREDKSQTRVAPGDEMRAEGDEGIVAGWASTHEAIDSYGTVIAKGAFDQSIREKGLSGPRGIKLLLNHNPSQVAGRITRLEQRDKGLWIEAKVDRSIGYADDAYKAAKFTGGLSFSVGFGLRHSDTEMVEEDGKEYMLIKKGNLREVSIVTFPANADSVMEQVRTEDEEEATRAWRVGAARNLPIGADSTWNASAARSRIFAAAGFDDGDPDPQMARRAFLVYDDENPTLKGGYKLPFADIVGGRLRAMPAGLRAAASRLPQTDIPEGVMARARSVLDDYFDKMERAAENLTLDQLQRMLVEEGWVKAGRVKDLTTIIRAHLDLFKEEQEEPIGLTAATMDNLRKAAEVMRRIAEK